MPRFVTDMAALPTIADWVRYLASRFNEAGLFFGHGTGNAVDEALALVLHVLHLDHDLPSWLLDAHLTDDEKAAIAELAAQRIDTRKPLAYLTHSAGFAGLDFYVDERVLVPRSPIAELIERQFEPWAEPDAIGRVLDIGTGSGCIAIACAHYLPDAQVDAVDISEDALAVADENVARHHLNERVRLIRSNLLADVPPAHYDVIVTNPPYVDAAEMAELEPEFRHEPALGLAAGEDGLDCIERILRDAPDYLAPNGILIGEVGASQPAFEARFPDLPVTWLDFGRGGSGVFLIAAADLEESDVR
ncbi:MAG TPA: 50S ribosomal protein L3 N(5)-glutamine methyltransferase [Gammaproteobacteria bacterium]|nr:50S ribosomal protein L3 N(5)-glutamine methyltransferase [Gammaproteobacteria bacterium]